MQLFSFPLALSRFCRRYAWPTLLLALLFSGVSLWWSLKLELKNDFLTLLPKDLPSSKTLTRVIEASDGLGYQAVIATSPDAKKNEAFLLALRDRLTGMFSQVPNEIEFALDDQYERMHTMLRDIFHYARFPNDYIKSQLTQWIKHFEKPPMVVFAYHRLDRKFFEKHQLLYLDVADLKKIYSRLRQKIRYEMRKKESSLNLMDDDAKDPGFNFKDIEDKYRSQGDQFPEAMRVDQGGLVYSALVVRPRGVSTDLDFGKQFIPALMKMAESVGPKRFHPKMDVSYSGGFLATLQEYNGIRRELFQSFGVTAGILLVLLFMFFRRKRSLWLIPIPLAMGLLWTMGFTYVFIGYLNTLTGFIAVLLLGLGIDYGIYLLDRYLEERKKGHAIEESLEQTFKWTGLAIAVGAATTAAGFLALLISRFRGFSQFGLIGGAGVFLCLLAMCTVMPALIAIFEKRTPMIGAVSLIRTRHWGKNFPFSRMLVSFSLLLIVAFVVLLRYLPFEYDFTKLSFQEGGLREQRQRWDKFKKISRQDTSPVVYITNNKEDTITLQKQIMKSGEVYAKAHKDSEVRLKSTMSALDLVPKQQPEKLRWLKKIKDYLDTQDIQDEDIKDAKQRKQLRDFRKMLTTAAFHVRDLPLFLQRDLVLYEKNDYRKISGFLVTVEHTMQTSNGWHAMILSDILRPAKIRGLTYYPSGEAIVLARIIEYLHNDSPLVILGSLIAVALLVLLSLRSVRLTLMALWPLLLGLFSLVIVQVIFRLPINLFNIVVIPSLLGIGIDSAVHMLHRYSEEPELGTLGVQREMASPIFMASLTTVISFASLVVSNHVGLRSMGLTAVIGLGTLLLGCLVLLPALMEVLFSRWPLQKISNALTPKEEQVPSTAKDAEVSVVSEDTSTQEKADPTSTLEETKEAPVSSPAVSRP
ncbi:MAG: MMPL family transporter [Myxococcales bacterium]|nr:MMPL family transporter [Myxococcales bacterium]